MPTQASPWGSTSISLKCRGKTGDVGVLCLLFDYAAAAVMRRLYGEAGHSMTMSNPAVPAIVLHYTSFRQITDDISDARVYGGIHYRTDQDAGVRLGRAVGIAVYWNNLRAVNGNDWDDDCDDDN